MRRFLALAALWVLLAACTDGGATEPGSTSTPSATASASGSPSASASAVAPPVMPEVAKEHTEAGAVAFVQHFWDVSDYAQQNLDVVPLEALVTAGCTTCRRGIEAIVAARDADAIITGGTTTIDDVTVELLTAGAETIAQVDYVVTNSRQLVDYPGTALDREYPRSAMPTRMILRPEADGWLVSVWKTRS